MADTPEISVIVGAYSRTEYLLRAVRSLAAQTLARDRFEIVVTTNFRIPEIDRALEAVGARTFFDDERTHGRWLRRAVVRSTAPIVTFLDDDDEYEPERLAEVVAVWSQHPDLGFYRNRVRVIDASGRHVPLERWRAHEVDRGFDALGAVYLPPDGRLRLLELGTRTTSSTFNNSSMAIRRELLSGDVGDAFDQLEGNEDTFLFLAGVLAPYGVYLDDRRLTRFRFHDGNVTRDLRYLEDAADSHRHMAEVAARHGRTDFAEWCRGISVHYQRMFRGSALVERVRQGAGRGEVVQRTAEYLRFLAAHPEDVRFDLNTWAAAAYGLAYPGAPSLVRRLARARVIAGGSPGPAAGGATA